MDSIDKNIRRVKRHWGWMLALGILFIVAGVFATMHPMATGLSVGIMLFLAFAMAGIASLVAAFRDAGWQAKTVDVLFGVLALIAAVLCIANPFAGAVNLVWVAGIMFLVSGVFEIVGGFRSDTDKALLIVLGIVDVLLGGYIVFYMGPAVALVTLAFAVGFGFIFRGVLLSVLAFKVRSVTKLIPAPI